MALGTWLKVFDAIVGVRDVARRMKRDSAPATDSLSTIGGTLGHIETRLAAVVVAALKEAFDRDSARMELERAQLEAERRRAEEALRLERLRQAGERQLNEARLLALVAVAVWICSAVIATRLLPDSGPPVKWLIGGGWVCLVAVVAAGLMALRGTTSWLAAASSGAEDPPGGLMSSAAPWLLVAGLILTSVGMLVAL